MRSIVALTLTLLAATATAAAARADEFTVTPGKPNQVVFTSKAPVESFEGKTSKLSGRIAVDPSNVGDSVTVELHVDLASLDTGIEKRNQHMRENHLETAKYPEAVFTGATVLAPKGAALAPGKPVAFDVAGDFALHGVTRRLVAHAEVELAGAGAARQLRFKATFEVSLADYAIPRPQFLFLKLADVQQLRVTGVATAR